MATVRRQTYTVELPASAEIFTKNRVKYAKWKGKRGKIKTGRLSADGTRVTVESEKWYVDYMDESGVQRLVPGFADRRATETLATEIQQRIDRSRAGILTPDMLHSTRPIGEHIDHYEAFLRAKGNTDQHVQETISQIRRVFTDAKIYRISSISLDPVQRVIAGLRVIRPKKKPKKKVKKTGENVPVTDEPIEDSPPPVTLPPSISAERKNHYIRACRSFTRWLVIDRRLSADPLAGLRLINASTDRRRVRRVLTPTEFGKLIQHTRGSDVIRQRMNGVDRSVLYTLAAYSGFRASELRSLTVDSFDFDSSPPCVLLAAKSAKNRTESRQPITDDLAKILRQWLAERYSGEGASAGRSVFDFWHSIRLGEMIREDIESAGIEYSTSSGIVDFHSLRVQFVTGLADANLPVNRIRDLARHESITTTAKYLRTNEKDLADGVRQLPPMPEIYPKVETDTRGSDA